MGQMTIRQIDDAALLRLKAKAKTMQVSAESLARQAILREAAELTGEEKIELSRRHRAYTSSLMVPGVKQTSAEVLIRDSRDLDH